MRRHFETFDALRFFSFLLVFLHHAGIPSDSPFSWFSHAGGIGVSFFFVLSGFLITYILLFEKKKTSTISLKNFFVRRILRIWPLYYAAVLFAFLSPYILKFLNLSSSSEGYDPNWLMSVLFLENYKVMQAGELANVSPLPVMWSLCIEEHFYIIWGLLFYFLPLKQIPKLIVLALILPLVLKPIYSHYGLLDIDFFTNCDYFAYGAIPAYFLVFNEESLDYVNRIPKVFKYIFLGFTFVAVVLISNFKVSYFFLSAVLGILFATVIAFTLGNRNSIRISDRSVFSVLGKYTYGLYIFHTVIIILIARIFNEILPPFGLILLSLAVTILVSILSYFMFEKRFLNLKKYFY